MKRTYPIFKLTGSFLALTMLAACSFSLAGDVTPPPVYESSPALETPFPAGGGNREIETTLPGAPFDLNNGASIYSGECASCHGETGKGDGARAAQLRFSPAQLGEVAVADQASPADWVLVVAGGRPERGMPLFTGLTSSQRWDVVQYALSLSVPVDVLESGKRIYQQSCATCHGDQGQAAGKPDFGNPATLADYSSADLQQIIAGGKPPVMPAFKNRLESNDIRAAAAYLRTFSRLPTGGESQVTPEAGGSTLKTPVAATGTVTFTGRVLHAAGKKLQPGLKVILQIYENMQLVSTVEGQTDAGGKFTFDGVQRTGESLYVLSAIYQDIRFFSEGIPTADLPEGKTPDISLMVYDNSQDTSMLVVERAHVFINFETPGTLQVVEMLLIRNSRQLVITAPEGQAALLFRLQPGASNLKFEDGAVGERYILTEDGFGDTSSIPPSPNLHQILFAYELPYESNKADLQLSFPLPVQSLLVTAPAKGVRLRAEGLSGREQRDVQGMLLQLYQVSGLAAGQQLDIAVAGWPLSGSGVIVGSTGGLLFGLGVFVLAVAAAGIFFFRRQHTGQETSETRHANEEPDVDWLLDAILALEDRYQAGELPAEAFQRRRAELKEQLGRVWAEHQKGKDRYGEHD